MVAEVVTVVSRLHSVLQLDKNHSASVNEVTVSDTLSACGLRLEHILTVLVRNKIFKHENDRVMEEASVKSDSIVPRALFVKSVE